MVDTANPQIHQDDEAEQSKRASDTPYGTERCFVCDGLVSASALTNRVPFGGRQHAYHDACGDAFIKDFLLRRKRNQISRARGSQTSIAEMQIDEDLAKDYERTLPGRLELLL